MNNWNLIATKVRVYKADNATNQTDFENAFINHFKPISNVERIPTPYGPNDFDFTYTDFDISDIQKYNPKFTDKNPIINKFQIPYIFRIPQVEINQYQNFFNIKKLNSESVRSLLFAMIQDRKHQTNWYDITFESNVINQDTFDYLLNSLLITSNKLHDYEKKFLASII